MCVTYEFANFFFNNGYIIFYLLFSQLSSLWNGWTNHLFIFPLTSIYFAMGEFFSSPIPTSLFFIKGEHFFRFSSSNLLLLWNGWTIVFNILMFHSFEVMKWIYFLYKHVLLWNGRKFFLLPSNISFLLKWWLIVFFFQLSSPLEWVHKLFFSIQPPSPWNGWTTFPFDHFFLLPYRIFWNWLTNFFSPFVFKNQCTFLPLTLFDNLLLGKVNKIY